MRLHRPAPGRALLTALLIVLPCTAAAAIDPCADASARFVSKLIRAGRACLAKAERGGSCGSSRKALKATAERVAARCPEGSVERLACVARQAIVASGLPYERLASTRFPHVCTSSSCGNLVTEPGEECDDGNIADGDGCSAGCSFEGAFCPDVCAGVVPVKGTSLRAERVAGGLSAPLLVTAPPGDVDRIFVVEQTGAIRIIRSDTLLPAPFLDLRGKILCCGERGLLGLAFHPLYANNGRFFVNYTGLAGQTVVAEYRAGDDPDFADPDSESVILSIDQPFNNHNGGHLAFDPDGYLTIGSGDGGGGGDPLGNAQSRTTLLGKILRIDVDSAAPYGIPPGNPFAGPEDPALDEIWATGLRNPWRFSFDRLTGDLYVGDVGQNRFEEIDFEPRGSGGGINYGWDIVEGDGHCFEPSSGCDQSGLTRPVHEYDHGEGCSVTGGYVYRGCRMPALHGTYFYADFCSAFVRTFRMQGGVATNHADRTAELNADLGLPLASITSFGEDARGEIYITTQGGGVFRVIPGP